MKRIVQTRWSARNDAVSVLCNYFPEVLEALEKLTGAEENYDTRSGAGIVISSLNTFPFFCYLGLWGKILPEVDDVQKYLQTKGLGLDQSVFKIQSLQHFLDTGRDRLVEEAIIYATTRCEEMGITITRRVRKRKRLDGVAINDEKITFQEELRRELFQVVDQLRNEINKRFEQMDTINKRFGFLQLEIIMDKNQDKFVEQSIDALADVYNEVDGDELKLEIPRFRRYMLISRDNNQSISCGNCTVLALLQWIVKWGFIETLPNLIIANRIFLTMSISVASCERCFSKLKLIKNYLRSTMSQIRLTSIAILSIERDITERLISMM